MILHLSCHPRESGGPGQVTERLSWTPAFAGVTIELSREIRIPANGGNEVNGPLPAAVAMDLSASAGGMPRPIGKGRFTGTI